MSSPVAYLSLGSNQGEPPSELRKALRQLAARSIEVRRVSSFYRTEPVDAPPEPWFVNAVAEVRSSLDPRQLLAVCQSIESLHGRERTFPNAPRTLDLDLLLAGDAVIQERDLTLPHPRLHRRRFVLVPMVEIAPVVVHPLLKLTMRELLRRCRDSSVVLPLEESVTSPADL